MKHTLWIMLSIILTVSLNAQDIIYTVNNWSGQSGVTKTVINPTNGNVTSTNTFATTPTQPFYSEALAINSSGWVYSIPINNQNAGNFEVYSVDAGSEPAAAPGSPVLTGTIPSGGANVFFRRLAVAPNGRAYMVVSDANSTLHFASFLTHANGTASDFQNLGTMTLSDDDNNPATEEPFFNGDLAFDGNGKMYVLVNSAVGGSTTKIYHVPAAAVNGATSSSNTTLQLMGTVLIKTTNFPDGEPFGGVVTGIAFASNGNMYLSAQSPNAGLFLISKEDINGSSIIIASLTYAANIGIGDIAGAAAPTTTILPVKYKSINARILNGELEVTWQTSSERGNERFDVEASKNGKNFVKIGSLKSKAINGISNNDLDYRFALSMNNVAGVLGISIFALAFLGLPVAKRKHKILLSLMMIIGVSVFAVSCSKRKDQIDTDNNNKIFIRIVQYDIDGKKDVSKIVTAYKAD